MLAAPRPGACRTPSRCLPHPVPVLAAPRPGACRTPSRCLPQPVPVLAATRPGACRTPSRCLPHPVPVLAAGATCGARAVRRLPHAPHVPTQRVKRTLLAVQLHHERARRRRRRRWRRRLDAPTACSARRRHRGQLAVNRDNEPKPADDRPLPKRTRVFGTRHTGDGGPGGGHGREPEHV
eukprot:365467-Chlamydomonas_euryale.AAC.16